MSELENKKQIVKDLLEKGKKKGLLTYDEINQALSETGITADEMETVYDAFEKEGLQKYHPNHLSFLLHCLKYCFLLYSFPLYLQTASFQ